MSIIIPGVPDHLTRAQYAEFFERLGFEPKVVKELRAAPDGVHVIVFATDENGRRIPDLRAGATGLQKHRIFIPVRDEPDDDRTTRITPMQH